VVELTSSGRWDARPFEPKVEGVPREMRLNLAKYIVAGDLLVIAETSPITLSGITQITEYLIDLRTHKRVSLKEPELEPEEFFSF
jgi:hypothetical protein